MPPCAPLKEQAIREAQLRSKKDKQGRLEFKPSSLKITNEHYARYEAISNILDSAPAILDLVHKDVAKFLDQANRSPGTGQPPCRQWDSDASRHEDPADRAHGAENTIRLERRCPCSGLHRPPRDGA